MAGAKKCDVTVHIKDDATKYPPEPPYEFWLETDDSEVGKKKCNELKFDNGGKYDGFDLTFKIHDHTGKGFKFMDAGKLDSGEADPDLAPMWVKKVDDFGESCPNREFWEQFETHEVLDNNTKLAVHNKNDRRQKFKFALMFSRTPDKSPCEIMYDPDGSNQNGGKPPVAAQSVFSAQSLAIAAIGGAIVGAVVTLGIQAMGS